MSSHDVKVVYRELGIYGALYDAVLVFRLLLRWYITKFINILRFWILV